MNNVCKSIIHTLLTLLIASWCYVIYEVINFQHVPEINENFWWGDQRNDSRIYPFKINVTHKVIDDLRLSLNTTRKSTPSMCNTRHEYGINPTIMDRIRKYILYKYDFEKRQEFLNSLPQFTTIIQGLNIHFIHLRPQNVKNLAIFPMLLLHGWPSSVREFYEMTDMLTRNGTFDDLALEWVIPSLPGFGYSDGPSKPGCHGVHMATILKNLMVRLGHQKFLVHGGDWGAVLATQMTTLYPHNIIGFHSNFCFSLRTMTLLKALLVAPFAEWIAGERLRTNLYPLVSKTLRFYMAESGYMHMMGTKPDTIGYILDSTPLGLSAFILEKISVGTNRNNVHLEDAGLSEFDMDTLIDNILFYYWFPRKAITAARIYAENLSVDGLKYGLHNIPISKKVPCGCAWFEYEFVYQPVSWLRDKYPNLVHFREYDSGGHFAALEQPEILANDIVMFLSKVLNNSQ